MKYIFDRIFNPSYCLMVLRVKFVHFSIKGKSENPSYLKDVKIILQLMSNKS